MTWILKAKGWLYGAAGIALTLAALLLRGKVLKSQRDSARDAASYYKAKAIRQRVINEADDEIEDQSRARRLDALRELESDRRIPDAFDANKLRDKNRADS